MVLVTGFSGRFPSSDSVSSFWENLCSGVDLVTENSSLSLSLSPQEFNSLPKRQAQLKDIQKFDALFFGISSSQASCLDPQIRLLLEVTYEAIIDAGYTMEDLMKSNTGVYVGGCFSDMHKALLKDIRTISGYENTGCSHSMFANRVSFCFDFTGPSMTIDTACSSSLVALDLATRDIRSGKVSRAIVAGVSIAIDPGVTKSFSSYGMLSPNGKCHSFDDQANGYVRADGIGAVLLESISIAKNKGIASILGTGINSDGFKVKGITFPDSQQQLNLCQKVCQEYHIDADNVIYVEAHGTGTVAGDSQELRAISAAYAPLDTDKSVMIGSVKSNMGHAEGASGIMSLIKVLCVLTDNLIPTNLHYQGTTIHEPILTGRLRVVDKTQQFAPAITPCLSDENEPNHPRRLIAINNFGFGGTNAHIVCSSGEKQLVVTTNKTRFLFGRTEEALHSYFNTDKLNEAAWQLLLRNSSALIKFSWRGVVLPSTDTSQMKLLTQKISSEKRPVAFCFTGQGCQWNGMAKDLWLNECNSSLAKVFKSTIIEACEGIDVNIDELFSNGDCWVTKRWSGFGITLVQLGLVAALKTAGIEPDYIFGHSVGEVACGFADGCTSAQEAARIAFIRSQLSDEINANGLMLAAGLEYDTAQTLLESFPETVIACHNSPDGVTLSGDEVEIQSITTLLKEKGVFAKVVPTDGIAYHSRFFQRNSDRILEVLDGVITDRPFVKRTPRWLSTSCPQCRIAAKHECHKYPDSSYHTRNITGQVNFEPIVRSLPAGTHVIEIGPHNLLKGIIKRCRGEGQEVSIYSTIQREENAILSLERLVDTLWLEGVIFNFPVVAHMVPIKDRVQFEWDHDVDWRVPELKDFERGSEKTSMNIEFDLAGADSYLMDHIIDGRSILPATAHVYSAWLAYGTDEIHFADIKILSAIILDGISVSLNVVINSNNWKIYHDEELVSEGSIAAGYQISSFDYDLSTVSNDKEEEWITSDDVYARFARFGYEYGEEFRAILSRSISGCFVRLRPVQHWIVYLDNMLQAFLHQPKGLFLPTTIGSISIRRKDVNQADSLLIRNSYLNSFGNNDVVIKGLKTTIARKFHKQVSLKAVEFVPYGEYLVKSAEEDFKRNLIQTLTHYNNESEGNHSLDSRIKTYLMYDSIHSLIDEGFIPSQHPTPYLPIYDESLYVDDAILSCKWCVNELQIIAQILRENLPTPYSLVQYGDKTRHHKLDALYLQFHGLVESDIISYVFSEHDANYPFTSTNHCDLILANNWFYQSHNLAVTLDSVVSTLKPGGFLLLREYVGPLPILLWGSKVTSTDVQDKRQYGRWIDVTKWLDLISGSILQPVMWCYDESCTQLVLLVYKPLPQCDNIIHDRTEIKSKIIATIETTDFGYLGAIRSFRKEPGYDGLTLRLDATNYIKIQPCKRASSQANLPISITCNGIQGGFFEVPLQKNLNPKNRGYYLTVTKPGDLQSLRWVENEIEPNCEVKFCGINFKDVMLSYGKLTTNEESGHVKIGLEYSGLIDGCPVMGISFGCMATHIKTTPHLLWSIPPALGLEDACTIPVVYSTVYYALILKANIQEGQTALIHSIAGGVGQAAYHVCTHRGVTVIATCSKEKREWVHEHLGIPYEHILDSHTIKFRDDIMCLTNGRGVDVVLNSLSGDKLHASMECVAQYGHFCEIGKFDIQQNTRIGMAIFERNVSVHGFDLSEMFSKPSLWQPIRDLVTQGLKSGEVKPLCSTVFDSPESALRYVGSGKHIGKVLVRIHPSLTLTPDANGIITAPHSNFKTYGTHLVVGGLGGFGLELILFLKSCGAEKIIISSRSSPKPHQLLVLGDNVTVSNANLKNYEECTVLVSSLGEQLVGVWHLGMVLNDRLYDNMTEQAWCETVSTKATICENLDQTSRLYSKKLQHFVMWSSVSALYGNAGQTNYAYGNSVMEGVCLARRSVGLPGLAIQWGFIGTVGVLTKKGLTTNQSLAFTPQHIDSCLESLNLLLLQSSANHSTPAIATSYIRRSPEEKNEKEIGGNVKVLNVSARIARVLGVDGAKISGGEMLSALGMDSMQSVEISNILKASGHAKTLEELRYVTWNQLLAFN